MVKLDLRLRPGEGQSAFESSGIAILIGQFKDFFASGSDDGGKNQMNGGTRWNMDGTAQANDRVEYRTCLLYTSRCV